MIAQVEVLATGHTEETLQAVDPTYESTGLTEGIKCSACGEILTAQQEIPKLENPNWDGTIAEKFDSGSGTTSDPYLIATPAQLAYLAKLVNEGNTNYNSKCYKLIKDINLNNQNWTPIGSFCYWNYGKYDKTSNDYTFQGTFNGNKHTISNLKITQPTSSEHQYFGLFGYAINAKISYVNITNLDISLNVTTSVLVGGIVGKITEHSSSISYCSVTGNINIISSTYGVTSGGIVGTSDDLTVSNCVAHCNVTVKGSKASYGGGLVGSFSYADPGNTPKIKNCIATGDVSCETTSTTANAVAGGLVGSFGSYCNTTNSVATGNVTGKCTWNAYVGGLFGSFGLYSATVTNCYYYSGQTITYTDRSGTFNTANTIKGTSCTLTNLNTKTFYTSTLAFSATNWNFDNLDFANGKVPTFIWNV